MKLLLDGVPGEKLFGDWGMKLFLDGAPGEKLFGIAWLLFFPGVNGIAGEVDTNSSSCFFACLFLADMFPKSQVFIQNNTTFKNYISK